MARARRSLRDRRRILAALLVMASIAAVLVAIVGSSTGTHPFVGEVITTRHAVRSATGSSERATRLAQPPSHAREAVTTERPNLAVMLGQMIVARFVGLTPPATILDRIRRGRIGGIILFSDNVAGGTLATRRLTRELQLAAAQGGNPPLLIMTDQEGGGVRRLAGSPALAPAEMASDVTAFSQGMATGRLLRSAGINVDLAPVADVERARASFLGSRSFGGDPLLVASRACAFAHGLAAQGIAYTLKHFPGLGRATGNTDTALVTVDTPSEALRADYSPYVACGANALAIVMVSSAIYPKLSGSSPAVMSPEIYQRELPIALGGRSALTISDDLESASIAAQTAPARRAVAAGVDLLMYAQTELASAVAYSRLVDEAHSGLISFSSLRAADEKILRLKRLVRR